VLCELSIKEKPNVIGMKFSEYRAKWENEIQFSSSVTEVISNMWFLKMIGLGKAALPYMRTALEEVGGSWCLAIEAVSGETPDLSEEDSTNFRKLREFWIKWLNQHGYASRRIP
jgi:hypothetical protein